MSSKKKYSAAGRGSLGPIKEHPGAQPRPTKRNNGSDKSSTSRGKSSRIESDTIQTSGTSKPETPSLRKTATINQALTVAPPTAATVARLDPPGTDTDSEALNMEAHMDIMCIHAAEPQTEDDWSDGDSVKSARRSLLPPMGKRLGVSMDFASLRANEFLQLGKDALERAGNMKRECKTEVHESLQGLYEVALSLSDSRARHMVNLEREQAKAAKELIRVERAHARQIAELQVNHARKLEKAHAVIIETAKTVDSISRWLNFELDGPIKSIEAIRLEVKNMTAPASSTQPPVSNPAGEARPFEGETRAQLSNLQASTDIIAEQMRSMRRHMESSKTTLSPSKHSKGDQSQRCPASPLPTEHLETSLLRIETDLSTIKELVARPAESVPCNGPKRETFQEDLRDAVEPLKMGLRDIHRDVKDVQHFVHLQSIPQNSGLATELLMTEVQQKVDELVETTKAAIKHTETRATDQSSECLETQTRARHISPRSYSEALKTPRPHYPLVVESVDPRSTASDVEKQIKTSVDVVSLGVGVNALRKLKNQKVVISCDTEADRGTLSKAIKESDPQLTVSKPTAKLPLLRLVGVAGDLSDAKLGEALISQNDKLVSNVALGNRKVKVIRRTKGRTDILSNVIVQVSPPLWGALRDQRLRVGYQVVNAVDQSPVVQCYRCLGFAHHAKECRADKSSCGYCSGDHDTRLCPNRGQKRGLWTVSGTIRLIARSAQNGRSGTAYQGQRWHIVKSTTTVHTQSNMASSKELQVAQANLDLGQAAFDHQHATAKGSAQNPSVKKIKFGQINLGRGYAATKECLAEATRSNITLLLIQEPYVGAKGYLTCSHRVIQKLYNNNEGPIRSAIVVIDPNINIVENPDIITENIVACCVDIGTRRIGIICLYMDKTVNIDEDLNQIERAIQKLDTREFIIAGDINASSQWWESKDEDTRGNEYNNFLNQHDLHILNTGNTPTFYIYRGSKLYTSIVDVTACSSSILAKIKNWRVDCDLATLSDHRMLQFEFSEEQIDEATINKSTRKYNTKKAKWSDFSQALNNTLAAESITENSVVNASDHSELEDIVERYTKCIEAACDHSMPKTKTKKKAKEIVWWTQELHLKKQNMIRIRRKIKKANPQRKEFIVREYCKERDEYKELIEQTITKSWKEFCTKQDKENIWQCGYRVLKVCDKSLTDKLLRSPEGDATLNEAQSAELLAHTFFPTDRPETDTEEQRRVREEVDSMVLAMQGDLEETESHPDFTHTEVRMVYNSMNPNKAPGEDGFSSDICQKAYMAAPETQLALFNKCLRTGLFPLSWKTAKIKVIPKPGKTDYTIPKSYRPIALLPILGKVLEKLYTNRIIWQLGNERKLSTRQYGFMPQIGTEDALYDAINIIKEGVRKKAIVGVVSLDIEGAFDNAWWPGVLKQLHDKNIPKPIWRLVASYLNDRSVKITYAGANVSKPTNKGCVQGSISGPLLWNVQLDPLLQRAEELKAHIQAFADDILVIATGRSSEELEEAVNEALKTVAEWGTANKMKFAAHKTQAIVITRKFKYNEPRFILGDVELKTSETLKVLGLTIDRTLNFRPHLDEITQKSTNIFKRLARAVKTKWGLNPEITRMIYTAAVEPVILYAVSIWGSVVNRKFAADRLDRMTRLFAIKISRSHRTVSMVASAVVAGILPLDLRVREHANLYEIKRGKPISELPGREIEKRISPYHLPHPSERKNRSYVHLNTQDEARQIGNNLIQIYTDGSKINGKVGAGVSFWESGVETRAASFGLADYCTVYQAELAAILRALQLLLAGKPRGGNIISDSRSSVDAVCDPSPDNPIVAEIQRCIYELEKRGQEINLYWVRAHIGIEGNERADELAKRAAEKSKTSPVYDCFPLSFARYMLRQQTLEDWQKRYSQATTGRLTRLFMPEVRQAYKIGRQMGIDFATTQIFTGHCGIRQYLHRFKLADNPNCTCDSTTPETVEHILAECPKYMRDRLDCEFKTGAEIKPDNFNMLLSGGSSRGYFVQFALRALKSACKANGSTQHT